MDLFILVTLIKINFMVLEQILMKMVMYIMDTGWTLTNMGMDITNIMIRDKNIHMKGNGVLIWKMDKEH